MNLNVPPPLGHRSAELIKEYQRAIAASLGPIIVAVVILFGPIYGWWFCRIEPEAGQIAVLIKKTGRNLDPGQIISSDPDQKGIQLNVLSEGRYFRFPFFWDWEIHPITDIPAGKIGVLTRLYGKDLPRGQIMAVDGETKGIVPEVLGPGKHRINPYAYTVETNDAVSIPASSVGVVVSMVGDDILNCEVPADRKNTFVVSDGMKGMLPSVLNPGTHPLNPYMFFVVEVNLQSQRFAMSGADAISFLTMDGFNVVVEGTVEFAIEGAEAALLTQRVGDMSDIVQKLILPRMRGFSRIEGSKHPAINFIVGETRQEFQNDLEQHLREKCRDWGVSIRSVLIRNIIPPDEIASIIRDREIAVQETKKFEQEILQAKSKAELVKQETLALQNKEKVEAETAKIRAVINAQQDQSVKVTAAQREFEVARIENEAAIFQAQAIVLKAQADADVIKVQNVAEADVMSSQVKAFGTGLNLARYAFMKKVAPRIDSILTTDQEGGLGELFQPFMIKKGEVR